VVAVPELRHHHAAIRHPQPHVRRPEAERPHDVERRRHDLGVGGRARLPDDIHVQLEVLAQPSPLLSLIAEQLGDREPADGFLERLSPRPHHARERRGHLGAQRDLAPAFVLEGVQLLHDLLAAFVGVQLERLERRAVVLLEAVAPRDAAPHGEDVIAEGQLFRVEIAEAGERFPLHPTI